MTVASQPLFLFGPGYCGQALAAIWDGPISAAVRSEVAKSTVLSARIAPVSCQNPVVLAHDTRGAHILVSAPPAETGCPGLAALSDIARGAASVTYLSTTGVYGDLAGGWVFEDAPLNPQSDRARLRVAAEQGWRSLRPDIRIVRLPGIYGPGRSPLNRVRAGQASTIIKPGQVFSRAHVDDIASGLKALILAQAPGVFNLCDDEAAPPQDVTWLAADLLGIDRPEATPFDAADLSPMALSFYAECKRVSNARLKAVTGWRPQYKTYRDGLRAILAAET